MKITLYVTRFGQEQFGSTNGMLLIDTLILIIHKPIILEIIYNRKCIIMAVSNIYFYSFLLFILLFVKFNHF
jgi:hypothetical protein